jgi:hypothetical protein
LQIFRSRFILIFLSGFKMILSIIQPIAFASMAFFAGFSYSQNQTQTNQFPELRPRSTQDITRTARLNGVPPQAAERDRLAEAINNSNRSWTSYFVGQHRDTIFGRFTIQSDGSVQMFGPNGSAVGPTPPNSSAALVSVPCITNNGPSATTWSVYPINSNSRVLAGLPPTDFAVAYGGGGCANDTF